MQDPKSVNHSQVVLDAMLTCPQCNFSKEETMPADACQFFYECGNCKLCFARNPATAACSAPAARFPAPLFWLNAHAVTEFELNAK